MPAELAEDDLFNAARRRAPDERATYLRSACGADEPLRARVEALLAAYDAADNPLDRVPAGLDAAVIERTLVDGPPQAPGGIGRTSPAEPSPRPQVALVPQAGRPGSADDVSVLLRKRLMFLALLLSAGLAVSLLFVVAYRNNLPWDVWGYFALTMFALGPLFAGVLRLRPALSLRQLRAIELILFGGLYAQWAVVHAFLYPQLHLPRPPLWFGFIVGYAVSLPWTFLIIAYGILIPNTWRRCAAVVGVMAVTPLVVSTASGLTATVTVGYSPANFLFVVGVCMAAASALAVYGSHRIEVLRREVSTARKLGQYVLKEQLGAGGMGEVYLAEHALLRRPCAIKVIRPERAGDPENLRRFEREVQATATLTHPNTVHVYDYGHADDGTFYYVMEYLPGLTLEELVKRDGPLPPARAVRLLRQICGALAEAHSRGLTHRDVKPGNVMVCERGGEPEVAKLLDFGLVLPPAGDPDSDVQLTRAGTITGTPGYLSPEQAGGRSEVDARSDVYSVGGLAYFLLTGHPPFAGRSPVETFAAHLYEKPKSIREHVPDVTVDLDAVVLRCLAKHPAERYPDAEALDAAMANCHMAS
jgi:serine/threonine-protein kinase